MAKAPAREFSMTARQPFVGLAVAAMLGIILADFLPVSPGAWLPIGMTFLIAGLAALRWPKLKSTYAFVGWRGEPQFGDEFKFFGIAEPIAAPRNPGEFDMRSYLARRDVRRSLFVRYAEEGVLVRHGGGNPILRAAQKSRAWMQVALCR